jgi:hypothetical protein
MTTITHTSRTDTTATMHPSAQLPPPPPQTTYNINPPAAGRQLPQGHPAAER